MGLTKLSKNDAAICCALALAAHYFPGYDEGGNPCGSFRYAAYLLSGQLDKWSRWRGLPHEEKQRLAAVMVAAPEDLSKTTVFGIRARKLLTPTEQGPAPWPFRLSGESGREQAAIPSVGGDLLAYVDRMLDRLGKDHRRRRPPKPADAGDWLTRDRYVAGHGLIQGKVTIPGFTSGAGEVTPLEVVTAPYRAEITIDVPDLLEVAREIDLRYPPEGRYLEQVLTDLTSQLNTIDSVKASDMIRLLAGPMEILNAPTGTGKSVLVRVAASWFALNGMTITIVLPTVDATLATTWDIHEDLQHLSARRTMPAPVSCTPLMSAWGLHDRAIKAAGRVEGAFLHQSTKTLWRIDQLAYGCALKAHTQISHPLPDGEEPCTALRALPPGRGTHSCPFMSTTCGKFEQHRQAVTASVLVTNHHNLMMGRFPLGVLADGRLVGDMTIAELVLRRSDIVMIDEVDQFQSVAIGQCAREIVLDSRHRRTVPLRQLDDDKTDLPVEAVKDLCPTISHARYLSEFLLASICTGDIHLRQYEGSGPAKDRPGLNTTGWHLAGGRDRRLITLLFPSAGITDRQDIPKDLFDTLNALHPVPPAAPSDTRPDSAPVQLPDPLAKVRDLLERVLAPRGDDLLAQVKLELNEALEQTVTNAHDRSEAIELLLVRTWLTELDDALGLLRSKTAQLRSVGLQSARDLAERLESKIGGNIFPYGMLGGAIVGYRVTGLDDPDKNAELTAQFITGDPHTYTAQLGSILSLALAGVERPVMGLSATAYFPQAVREHVHADVKWWMTDAAPASIRAERHMITDAVTDKAIQISGIPQAMKRRALITLGERLYDTEIHNELARIERTDPARAHAAVVVNSYEHCRHIAIGIHNAGRFTGGLCIAVPAEASRREQLRRLAPLPPDVVELTPDEFETFPTRGRILIVPMARIARGLNIVIGTKSAITPVYLCTRPLALLTDPPEMYASVNAAGLHALPALPSDDPVAALAEARQAAWQRLGVIMRSAPGFVAARPELQEEIVAGMIVDMIQLAGRARRGGTDMTLHLVDYAFHEDSWQSDLANILRRMYDGWHPDTRRRMNAIYREALAAFLAYAGIDTSADDA
ncbi:hypothetical protein AB0O34_32600 [Sphaerisporangium sp. NPDC088356]|uniref:hypothetical protein n=1 Tax=Sphaerisporangium sp. NPDC088356 TaxID=3154871 RepID=UPI003432B44B